MSNLVEALTPKYPEDIAKIRAAEIPIVGALSGIEIQVLWEKFSDDHFAGWLTVTPPMLEGFRDWL